MGQQANFRIVISGTTKVVIDADTEVNQIVSDMEEVLGKHDADLGDSELSDMEVEQVDEKGNFPNPDAITDLRKGWFF